MISETLVGLIAQRDDLQLQIENVLDDVFALPVGFGVVQALNNMVAASSPINANTNGQTPWDMSWSGGFALGLLPQTTPQVRVQFKAGASAQIKNAGEPLTAVSCNAAGCEGKIATMITAWDLVGQRWAEFLAAVEAETLRLEGIKQVVENQITAVQQAEANATVAGLADIQLEAYLQSAAAAAAAEAPGFESEFNFVELLTKYWYVPTAVLALILYFKFRSNG